MQSFLEESLLVLNQKYGSLNELVFILPSQRAGSFLKNIIAKQSSKAAFLPEIHSIEKFVQQLSTLNPIDNTTSIFKLYEVYLSITEESLQEDFQTFNGWAQTIIQDFNEIDRFLIPSQELFNYLSLIKDNDHWYLSDSKTALVENYLRFWKQLPKLYSAFTTQLLSENLGYQGLQYKIAAQNIVDYASTSSKTHSFIGFNALNAAEQHIIAALEKEDRLELVWDIDLAFMSDTVHDASHFIRHYQQEWAFLKDKPLQFSNYYSQKKAFNIIGTPKKIGQAKAIGQLLCDIPKDRLSSTAIVLGDESLLLPVLNAIPSHIDDINITMGLPLRTIPLASFFELLFKIQLQGSKEIYYKLILEILNHPSIQNNLGEEKMLISEAINKQNIVSISKNDLLALVPIPDNTFLELVFSKEQKPSSFLKNTLQIIECIKSKLKENDAVLREYLYAFNTVFNELMLLVSTQNFVSTIELLHQVYKDALSTKTLDFIGKKHDGLQIMGVLETRVLDFETVIIASVNEGVFPSGKSNNSYIPYDVKRDYKLPTYKEKDAVYTYHFYHMLQRANDIHIIYNTEPGDLNSGEKSRFITQLEVESKNFPNHTYTHQIFVPEVPKINIGLRHIKKTPQVIAQLQYRASKGFSPSALTTYMRNPIDFYNRYVLGVGEIEEVEETVAYNTLGTVVHDTLWKLYEPYKGELLNAEIIAVMKSLSNERITQEFTKTYSKSSLDKGKNLLIFEVAKRYVHNFLELELSRINAGEEIHILELEADKRVKIEIESLDFPIYLRGQVDRYEVANGIKRVIDYKTGNVAQNDVVVKDWELITSDYKKFSKPFQILQYAYMMHLETPFTEPIEAGIVSFKNLKSGFLPFKFEKDTAITSETFSAFEIQLKALIKEICDPTIPFIEKEIPEPFLK